MTRAAPGQNLPAPPFASGALLAWYDRHARDLPWRVGPAARARGVRPDPYRVWLSEVMLQQTTIAAVKDYFAKFVERWPRVEDLAAAPREDVMAAWAGLGYYARARNLHACAITVASEHGGQFPTTSAGLRALPGIGAYTSAAIAAICHDEPVAVVDGNVERVMARLMALPEPVATRKKDIHAAVQAAVPMRAGDFAQAMMDLGATICAPRRANCLLCPLSADCAGYASANPLAYPVAAQKKHKPRRFGHAFIMRRHDGAVFVRERPATGLLAQMTEVPNSPWSPERAAPRFPLEGAWREAGQVVHTFTHLHLTLSVWVTETETPLDEGWWSAPETIAGEAWPSLFRKVLAMGGVET